MAWRLYDFKCLKDDCGEVFEDLIQPGDVPPCKACGHTETQRLMAAPAVFSTIQAQTRTSRIHSAGGVHKKTEKSSKIWVPVSKGE